VPEPWQESLNAALRLSRFPLQASRELLGAARTELSHWLPLGNKRAAAPPVPIASFNADIGSERGFVFGSLPLADVKDVKNHFGVTVNDVVLALVAGSLRRYLLGRGDLPEDALRTSIAVSLRTDDDDQFSNRVTTATVTLATDLTDPVRRLRAIADDAALAKEEARSGALGFLEIMSMFPPVAVNAMMRATPVDLVTKVTGFNLLVSNVRGSPMPMYIGGARTTAVYPMSILMPGNGINVTCISYLDRFEFGLTIEPRLFPDPWLLIDGLHEALEDYMKVIRQRTRLESESAPARSESAEERAEVGAEAEAEAEAEAAEPDATATHKKRKSSKSKNDKKDKKDKKAKKKHAADPG
jgi:WS/DGAT/MGAT family acyltransferase